MNETAPVRRTWLFAAALLVALAGCVSEPHARVARVQIDGVPIDVSQNPADPSEWSAFAARLSDRTSAGPSYFARNIDAIEQVSGCAVDPAATLHSVVTTVARVAC